MPQEASASIRIRHLHNEAQSRMRRQLRVSLFHLRQTTNVYLLRQIYQKFSGLSNGLETRAHPHPAAALPTRSSADHTPFDSTQDRYAAAPFDTRLRMRPGRGTAFLSILSRVLSWSKDRPTLSRGRIEGAD